MDQWRNQWYVFGISNNSGLCTFSGQKTFQDHKRY